MKSVIQYRPNEVDMSALEVYFEQFDRRPKLIVKSSAAAKPYDPCDDLDEDDSDKHKQAMRIALFNDVIKQFNNLVTAHKVVPVSYHISYPENHYDHVIFVVDNRSKDHIVFEASVAEDADPIFTLFGEARTNLFEELDLLLNKIERPEVQKPNMIHLVAMSGSDFWLNSIDLKHRQHEFTYDNYNDDFKSVSDTVISSLRTANQSGLVLFHGGVGTGKTSYMKYLLSQITSKKIIYIPPDMVTHLSSPAFVSFMIRQAKDSILLVEDAETVLQKREGGQNQSVSNILNISDGILGDILQIQLVCTFNCALDRIDPALMRPGRLIAEYKFDKLTLLKTRVLLDKLYGTDFGVTEGLSIAEIYNYKKLPPKSAVVAKTRPARPKEIIIQSVEKIKNAN